MRAAVTCILAAAALAFFVWSGAQPPRHDAAVKPPNVLAVAVEPHTTIGAHSTTTARLSIELPTVAHNAQEALQSPGAEDALLTEAAHRQGGPERASDDSASDMRPAMPDVTSVPAVDIAARPLPPLPPPAHPNVASSSAEPLRPAKPEGAADDEGGD